MIGLAELSEHAKGGFRMQEGDELIAGTREGNLMDKTSSFFLCVGELTSDVVSGEGDVVDARAVFFKEFRDRTVLGCGFEEFDMDVSCGEEGGADFLGFHFLASFTGQAKNILIIGDGFIQRFYGDS